MGREKRRAREQAQIHRVEVMTEPRKRRFRRLDRPAGLARGLEDPDLPALGRQVDGGRQTVVTGAHDDRVISHARTRPREIPCRDNLMCTGLVHADPR